MIKVLYPGTFDPPTLGHLNIIQRASSLFDSLIVAIGQNSSKSSILFSTEEREEMLQSITHNLENVQVNRFEGLVVDYAKQNDCQMIIRSFRNISDIDYELVMADQNKQISGVETIFIFPDSEYRSISSKLVKELGRGGKRLYPFIPKEIEEKVFSRFQE
jgi:pantetheine-phosphate adenylyltransferase